MECLCSICLDLLRLHDPATTPCGHTFHREPCLRTLLQQARPECPLCRAALPRELPAVSVVLRDALAAAGAAPPARAPLRAVDPDLASGVVVAPAAEAAAPAAAGGGGGRGGGGGGGAALAAGVAAMRVGGEGAAADRQRAEELARAEAEAAPDAAGALDSYIIVKGVPHHNAQVNIDGDFYLVYKTAKK
jgi:hypothetical protein